MVTVDKIDEWIREAEERPSSALNIIRFIANRLSELTKWNEELLSENLELRTGKKVEEYEFRIATLEYQMGLLKRQLGGELGLIDISKPSLSSIRYSNEDISVLIYNPSGLILRFDVKATEFLAGETLGKFSSTSEILSTPFRIITASSNEEILLVFDTGRTVTLPITDIPTIDSHTLDWQKAFISPPLGTEELAFIKPIGRMGLFDYCLQISRKACVKKVKESLFESYLQKSYIGTGILSVPDKTFDLIMGNKTDIFILVSKEGFLQALELESLPSTIEEVQRLEITDHIIAAITAVDKHIKNGAFLFITQSGKIITRDISWIDLAKSYRTKGQQIFTQERRDAGTRLVFAGIADENNWSVVVDNNGKVFYQKIDELLGRGKVILDNKDTIILGFSVISTGI